MQLLLIMLISKCFNDSNAHHFECNIANHQNNNCFCVYVNGTHSKYDNITNNELLYHEFFDQKTNKLKNNSIILNCFNKNNDAFWNCNTYKKKNKFTLCRCRSMFEFYDDMQYFDTLSFYKNFNIPILPTDKYSDDDQEIIVDSTKKIIDNAHSSDLSKIDDNHNDTIQDVKPYLYILISVSILLLILFLIFQYKKIKNFLFRKSRDYYSIIDGRKSL